MSLEIPPRANSFARKVNTHEEHVESFDPCFDKVEEKIYVADLMGNAIQVVSMDGTVTTLAKNGPGKVNWLSW